MGKTYADLTKRRLDLIAEGKTITDKGNLADGDESRLQAIEAELATIETDRNAAVTEMQEAVNGHAYALSGAAKNATDRAANIAAACALMDQPAKAHGFITSGKSLEDVQAELKASVAPVDDVNPRNTKGSSKPDTAKSWGSAIDKVNARVPGH